MLLYLVPILILAQIPMFTWKGGSKVVAQPGLYGTRGDASINNIPGARTDASLWLDESGDFWMFGGLGVGNDGQSGVLNDLWKYNHHTREWTWLGGNKVHPETGGHYGEMGIQTSTNFPGARWGAMNWIDKAGNMWLFGGWGMDNNGIEGHLNDLWIYKPTLDSWIWMGGTKYIEHHGTYGAQGIGDTNNIPASSMEGFSWTTSSGKFWLFGGMDNYLWRYDPETGEWTWWLSEIPQLEMGQAHYGSMGVSSPNNIPGMRMAGVTWIDSSDNLWLFSGSGTDKNNSHGPLNDLWKFNASNGEWTWMGGSDLVGKKGIYGNKGVASADNIPGARVDAMSWKDHDGNFWLFGGRGMDMDGTMRFLNDLWKYDTGTGVWTWMRGDKRGNEIGFYGEMGITQTSNLPGGRARSVNWVNPDGNLMLFGGTGFDVNGEGGQLNDLWEITFESVVTSINDKPQFKSEIYPNPATDYIKLRTDYLLQDYNFYMNDLLGKRYNVIPVNHSTHEVEISVSGLPTGLYSLTIVNNQKLRILKFIKK